MTTARRRLPVEAARRAGFDNINLDLMFGLPGQTTDRRLLDLRTATALAPGTYLLVRTHHRTEHLVLPAPAQRADDDTLWEMQAAGRSLLQACRLSALRSIRLCTQPARQCRHNLNYWQFGDYLGIGAGAHGKITDAATQTITASPRVKASAHLSREPHTRHSASAPQPNCQRTTSCWSLP